MSSPRPPNNSDVQYPAIPPSGTSPNSAGGILNHSANQESNPISATTRQTRSSGRGAKIALESLGPIDELSRDQLREQQQYEINRIINGSPDEALGQFHHADKAAMTLVYKQLTSLIHPDKQPDEWKGKATQAQQILNNARDKFDISIITPEAATERPKRSHKVFWETSPFRGSVRRLQINPSHERAIAFIEKVNNDIEAHNNQKGYNPSCGKFPLKYLQDKYQSTQALRTTYKSTTDLEQKKELAAIFEAHCVATQEFCEERAFPGDWAWQYTDIDKDPPWLLEAEEPQSGTDIVTGSSTGTSTDTGSTGTGTGTGAGIGAGIGTGTGTVIGSSSGTGTDTGGTGTSTSAGTGSASGNHDDAEMRDAPAGAGFADMGISEAMDELTLEGEPIKAKRKVFKNFQFLVQEISGLHVWKSAGVPSNLDLDTIKTSEKLTKDFIAQHKYKYKGIRWIAMSVDDAITSGAGQYPRISVMVEWLGDLEDSLLSRSDLIRVAGEAQVDRDLQKHLPYRKLIEFEGRKVYIMSQTEAGLVNGEMKAMQRIKKDQFKLLKASQTTVTQPTVAQPGFAQPGFAQLGVAQSGFAQPGFAQLGVAQSGFAQPGVAQPGVAQPGVAQPGLAQPAFPQQGVTQSGFVQPGFAQPGFAQSGVAQPAVSLPGAPQAGVTQPAVTQAGTAQPGVAQPIQADMIPSSVVHAMITSAVQQALQQHQQQSAPALAAR